MKPSRVIAVTLWAAAALCGVLSLVTGLNAWPIGYGIAGVLFVVMLCWILAHLPPRVSDLPVHESLHTRRMGFAAAGGLVTGGIILVFFIGLVIGPGTSTMALLAVLGLIISIAGRRELDIQTVLLGISAGAVGMLGTLWLGSGDFVWAVFNLLCVPPTFIAGALLVRRTGLGRVQMLEGNYSGALKGFLSGCALAVPAALLNLAGNLQAGDTWVQNWWQPLQAIVPAVVEETWARMFLLTLIYALLRPVATKHPGQAMAIALVASSLVHAFAHSGINPLGLVIGGMLYGIPAGLLLIKKDLEHAMGYHFLIDLVRWVAALAV